MRRLGGLVALAAFVASVAPAGAQSVHVGAGVGRSTWNEVRASERHRGLGASGEARVAFGSWRIDGRLDWASLSPADTADAGESVTRVGGGLRAGRMVWRTLAVEAGFESSTADPEFQLQDVALATLGLYYEAPLVRGSELWVRGAAVPWSSFNGGGDAGLGFALGLGVRAGRADGRLRGLVSYDFRRLDRTVAGGDVPIQFEGVRIGIEYVVR